MADSSSLHVTAIVAAGGSGRRLGSAVPKQLLELGGQPILRRSVEAFLRHPRVTEVIVAVPAALAESPPDWLQGARVVTGGPTRQASVANGFEAVSERSDIVLVHDAARPFVTAGIISRAIDGALAHGAAIPAVPVSDTVKRVADGNRTHVIVETLPRERIYLAQTPQAFRRAILGEAVALGRRGVEATDEAALAEHAGHRVHIVNGEPSNVKITTAADLESARARTDRADGSTATARIGVGYDLHRLVEGRPLILGGVTVPSDRGALGHSDADVVCHAVTDAILGAGRAGDIGQHFPDTDAHWKDASSVALLRAALAIVRERGWIVENVDVVVVLERPRLAPFRPAIEEQLARALEVADEAVSVKAKTNEGVDAVGRGEAVAAHAVVLLSRRPDRPTTD
jgi:2-C-methyl-D-erythritol 4-phosphate cytidylyltransferase/2-C-methyl-D-erythritol 2,4-cyclodiphosphate synthase